MYTSYIGKKFLKIYKEKENKPENYSAKEFFEGEMFPLFFQDGSHLMHVGNSPFFQKTKEEDNIKFGSKSLAQLNNLQKKIEVGIPSGSIYVGYGAEEIQATSSGQLTSLNIIINETEIYSSWIGEALAIGINGGFVMLIDEEEVLLKIYKGWSNYRNFLSQTPKLKDKQIETWNGHWICQALSLEDLNDFNYSKIETAEVVGNIAIPTQRWSEVLFVFAKKYPLKVLTVYAYTLSQTNTTLGFINLYLPDVRRMFELRDKLFLNNNETILNDKEIETLEPFYRFNEACKMGAIGLKSIEPRGLREFMSKGTVDYASGKDYKFTDEKSITNFQLYKLWIIAMLNKTELLKLATDVASALSTHETQDTKENRGKSEKSNLVKEILESKNLKSFIDSLTSIITKENAYIFKSVVEEILKMPSDNFPLFATLIRFEYIFLKKN
ncbi:hypothetical protein AAKU52_003221 [Pedobacter sp. CG_S7]|uniref:hypothetical protein n=1 Tax=Pedobacter sp. CG_S7 TaxID=3143930 RepID=UPI003397D7C7